MLGCLASTSADLPEVVASRCRYSYTERRIISHFSTEIDEKSAQSDWINDIDYDRLEVSSPGMDRVLKSEANFMRFVGERATVKLRVAITEVHVNAKDKKEETVSKKNFLGILRGVEAGQLLLECDGVMQKIAISNIEKSRLSPVF